MICSKFISTKLQVILLSLSFSQFFIYHSPNASFFVNVRETNNQSISIYLLSLFLIDWISSLKHDSFNSFLWIIHSHLSSNSMKLNDLDSKYAHCFTMNWNRKSNGISDDRILCLYSLWLAYFDSFLFGREKHQIFKPSWSTYFNMPQEQFKLFKW